MRKRETVSWKYEQWLNKVMIGPETNREQWEWRKKKKITIIVGDFQASTKYTGGRESKTHLIQDGWARLGELEQGIRIQLSRKSPPA